MQTLYCPVPVVSRAIVGTLQLGNGFKLCNEVSAQDP